jgi:hypothetical protein
MAKSLRAYVSPSGLVDFPHDGKTKGGQTMSNLDELTIINRNGTILEPFIVPVPKAYIVDLAEFDDSEATKQCLLASVQRLREVMVELDIDEATGYIMGLTLNMDSAERLARIAWNQGKVKLGGELWAKRDF